MFTADELGLPPHTPIACGNCDWRGQAMDIGVPLYRCTGLGERLDPGGEVPAGDCPRCKGFAYVTRGIR